MTLTRGSADSAADIQQPPDLHQMATQGVIRRSLAAAQRSGALVRLVLLIATTPCSIATAADPPFTFRDIAMQAGVMPIVAGMHVHGAAWGDVDSDGWPDLYVGTFHKDGSRANRLLRNRAGQFQVDDQSQCRVSGRANGMVFADLDNDGDLDLYCANLGGGSAGHMATTSRLFRNAGAGRFVDISVQSGACPDAFRGRGVCVLDFDGDGRLDILLGEGVGYGSSRRSRLLKNLGDLRFIDVSATAGPRPGIPGMGVAAADVNLDGWPDVFLTGKQGGNRLLINDGQGLFEEPPGLQATFDWKCPNADDNVCGVAFGDINRDGLPEIILGQHFDHPWREPEPIRLYLHGGIVDGSPRYRDVTAAAGLKPLPMKAPHVEIQDFDNDGWPDIYTSVVKFSGGVPHPLIYRNLSVGDDGMPHFVEHVLAVNDFPTEADRNVRRSGQFADKMLSEGKIIYMASGPSCDFDLDGRLDLFLGSWWPQSPSLLLKNETPSRHWLDIQVTGTGAVNRMGIGTRVMVYDAGHLGDPAALIGCREISVGYGYVSGQQAIAHFGLGDQDVCDVRVVLPHGHGTIDRRHVPADQRIELVPAGE